MILENKKVIIPGGASGLGECIAKTFAKEGAAVAILDIKEEEAKAVAQEIGGIWSRLDIRSVAEIDKVVNWAVEELGGVDILVNSAGLANRTLIENVTEEEWDSLVDVNMKGSFFCAQAVYRHMIAQGSGSIINLASLRGHRSDGRHVIYDATKGAVQSMTHTFAVAGGPYGVRCNSISPGYVLTPMTQHNLSDPNWKARIESRVPLGRMMYPEEIANMALYLASDASSGMTGQDLIVDGGWGVHE